LFRMAKAGRERANAVNARGEDIVGRCGCEVER